MPCCIMSIVLAIFCLCLQHGAAKPFQGLPNDRPVIGILAQEMSKTLLPPSIKGNSYIAASYVKYIESAGARVYPIPTNFSLPQLKEVFKLVNGILIPGGGAHIPSSAYFKNAKAFFEMALEANDAGDYLPIWGTCLGFHSLNVLVDDSVVMDETASVNLAMPLNFTDAAYHSRMFGKASAQMMQILSKEKVTYNFHKISISKKTFENSPKLRSFFNVLSFNDGEKGKVFVSTIEGKKYPVYASQWHPEKNTFEWNTSLQMPHSSDAVQVSQMLADFFVNEARKSTHHLNSAEKEKEYLVYRYSPVATPGGHFEQVYVF